MIRKKLERGFRRFISEREGFSCQNWQKFKELLNKTFDLMVREKGRNYVIILTSYIIKIIHPGGLWGIFHSR